MVSELGHMKESVKLFHGDESLNVVAPIDTSATTLILPKNLAERLGVRVLGEKDAELVDGTLRRVKYGAVEVELKGRRAPAFAAIVEKGEDCIGVEVLERLGLAVDPASGRIYPTRRFVTRL